MTTSACFQRGGYTAIELMLVLSIVSVLSMMSAPSVVTAMRKAAITEAADVVVQASSEARNLALSNRVQDEYYGVVVGVDANGRGYAALTYGSSATPGDILLDPDNQPVLKFDIKRTVALMKDNMPMEPGEHLGWMHQYTTGATVTTAAQSALPASVGTTGSAVCSQFGVQSLDGRYGAGIAIYPVGMAAVDVEVD